MNGHISAPPDELSGFPGHELPAGTRLWIAHGADRYPCICSCTGSGRFDLAEPWGTAHFAAEPLGALLECCLRESPELDAETVRAHRLSSVVTERPLRLADLTSSRAFGFGLTAEVHSLPDYGPTQAWARALHGAGFDGVAYLLRHDPSGAMRGVARFGRAGERRDWPPADTAPMPAEVLRQAAERFGVRLPEARSRQRA